MSIISFTEKKSEKNQNLFDPESDPLFPDPYQNVADNTG